MLCKVPFFNVIMDSKQASFHKLHGKNKVTNENIVLRYGACFFKVVMLIFEPWRIVSPFA